MRTRICIFALFLFVVCLNICAAQQTRVNPLPANPKIYEQYAGNYRLADDRFVSLGAFSANGNRLAFYDSKTRRVGALYDLSDKDFVSGVMRGNEFLAGDVRVTFIKDRVGVVTGLIWREGEAPVVGAAKVSPHRNEEVTFSNGDVTLRGTLTLPATRGPFPAVVFLHGGDAGRRPAGVWPYFLARYGIATLFFDKRDAWQTSTFDDLAGDALAAVRLLSMRKDINPRQIGLWGNSNSGWVVPIAAARSPQVAFVISRAGSSFPTHENILYEIEGDARSSGLSEPEIKQAVALRKRYHDAVITNAGWEQLKAELERSRNERWFNVARVRWLLTFQIPPDKTTLQGLRNPLINDPLPFWERVTCPVLALNGEMDMNVPTARSVPLLDAALKRAGNKDYTIVVLPNASHGLAEADTDTSPEAMLNRRYVAGYMDGIVNWLERRLNAKDVTPSRTSRGTP